MKVIPIQKQSKKQQKEFYRQQRRTQVPFNTGTRDMGKTKDEKFDEIFKAEMETYK